VWAPIGAHTWHPIAWDAQSGLVYLAATESAGVMAASPVQPPYRPGLWNDGTELALTEYLPAVASELRPDMRAEAGRVTDFRMRGFLRAIDPLTGRLAWQAASPGGWWDRAGVLATGGGLVFQGTGTGQLRAFDAASGKLLNALDVRSTIMAAPMTYRIGAVQYVAVMAGWGGGGWSIAHPEGAAWRYGNEGRIIVFRLDGSTPRRLAPRPPPGPIPPPPAPTGSPAEIARGAALYRETCAACHTNMDGSLAPDLRRMSPAAHAAFRRIVLDGALKDAGMPAWGDVLTPADAEAIHAWLISIARSSYAAQQRGRHAANSNLPLKTG
jgi:quinohemoprotein ethanol dehydrogenase